MASVLRITLVRSVIGYPQDQRATVRSLGLRRMNSQSDMPDTPVVRGMLHKVRHLVRVTEGDEHEAT